MAKTFRFTNRDEVFGRAVFLGGALYFTVVGLLNTPTPVSIIFYALEAATPLLNYALRAARSHTREERELKIKILDSLNENEGREFVEQVIDTHKSDPIFSTKTSKRFDKTKCNDAPNSKYKKGSMETLKKYMTRESILGTSGYGYNSGRALFGNVMTTRSINWMLRRIEEIQASDNDAKLLIDYIKTHYKPNFIKTSKESKQLYLVLNTDVRTIKDKIGAIERFLREDNVKTKEHDKSFSMLSTIEKGLANDLKSVEKQYHSDRGYSHNL